MTRSSIIRISTMLLLFPLFLTACHRAEFTPSSSSQTKATFQGQMLWNKTPIKKAALFLRPLSHGGSSSEIEFITRTDGRFEIDLEPGRYRLRSAPTTMCPVKGIIDLKPGINRYRLMVHPLSFLTCKPGIIQKL